MVGVHSPKFAHEADPDALAAAVERYEVAHPVLDDPELETWQAYTARAWPTLVLVDPEGYVVAQYAGEGHAHAARRPGRRAAASSTRPRAPCSRATRPYVPPAAEPGDAALPGQGGPAAGRRLPGRRRRPPPGRRAGRRRGERRTPDRVRRPRAGRRPAAGGALQRAQRAVPAARGRRRRGRLRRGGRGHRQPRAARRRPRAGEVRHARRHRAAVDAGRRPPPCPVEPVGRRLVAGPGRGSRWPASTSSGRSTRCTGTVEVAAGTTERGAARRAARPRRGSRRPRASPPTGTGCGSRTARPRALRYVEDGAVHTAVGRGCSTSASRTARRRQALLQHPLGVTRAAGRLGRGRRHLQRRGTPVRPGHRRGDHARHRPGRAQRRGRSTAEHLVVVESAAHRLTRVPLGGGGPRRRVRAHHPAAGHRDRRGGELELVVSFDAAARAEGRRPVRAAVAAARLRDAAGAAPVRATAAAPT